MERRVMGVETEYGVRLVLGHRDGGASAEQVLGTLVSHCGEVALGSFLANGGRLYPDCGHIEYATPECCDPMSVVVADRAGEEIVDTLGAKAAGRLSRWGYVGAELYKHSSDGKGHVFGCHENYQADAALDPVAGAQALGAFLLTRVVWAGAGSWDPAQSTYRLSQRGPALSEVCGRTSTRCRPLVHLKDEALGDARRWRRIHVLAGDANISEEVTWLKLATTSLVLSVVEQSTGRWHELCPAEFRPAMDDVDAGLGGQGRYRTRGGAVMSALEVQWRYHHAVGTHLDAVGGEPWARPAWQRWGEVLDSLGRDGAAGVVGVCDWATKLDLLESVAARRGGGMGDERVAYTELRYHAVGDGYGRRLEASGRLGRLSAAGAVDAAVGAPPEATRAATRSWFVRAAHDAPEVAVNWDWVRVGRDILRLEDPQDGDWGKVARWAQRRLGAASGQ